MKICYLGPVKDYSGYGEANRHAVAALYEAGVQVNVELVSYTIDTADFGEIGRLMNELVDTKFKDYQIKILHITPDQYHLHMEKGKYHIGHFFWETSKVPVEFAKGLELMDEIWTGSEANKSAIENSGVKTPVHIFPQANETDRVWPDPYKVPEISEHDYVFYSVFEWTDRKNPQALLEAYWREFQNGEPVALLLKTYFSNFTLQNKQKITHAINAMKARMGLKNFPPVYLYMDLMDRNQIMRFHKTGDCFISAHRGEGWGIPQVEAMLAGKPVITTGYGGVNEYFTDGLNAKVLPFKMVPLFGMEHSSKWYTNEQQWADVDKSELQKAMREAFTNQGDYKAMADKGKKFVEKSFNLKVVGELMAHRLKEIENEA